MADKSPVIQPPILEVAKTLTSTKILPVNNKIYDDEIEEDLEDFDEYVEEEEEIVPKFSVLNDRIITNESELASYDYIESKEN